MRLPRVFTALCLVLFALSHSTQADSPLVFNEIMYHPLTNEPALDWVELLNQLAVDLDVSGWALDGDIRFTFAEGTIVTAGDLVVVASSPATLAGTGVANPLGPFSGRLSNTGAKVGLRNNNGRLMDELSYGVEGDWPVAPDGAGPSLARRRANTATREAGNWTASAQVGGTPGRENFPATRPAVVTNGIVAMDGAWRFNDTGADLGQAWRETGFDDSSWAAGPGAFFQTDSVLPATKNTPLAPGRITYYFRTPFVLTGDLARVRFELRPLVDDGAVGYVNGTEAFRVNMPAGAVNHATLALGPVGDATFGEAIPLPPDLLRAGANTLAVEVHQAPSFANYPQTVLASGPVAYWRLGESSGAARDASPVGGAQNGTYAGIPTSNLTQPGPRSGDLLNGQLLAGFEADNAAPRFAGNADGGNDVITIPDSGIFNFSASRTFTLAAWVNGPATQEDGAAILAKGTGGGGEQFAIDLVGGNFRFFAWDGGVPNTPFVCQASLGPNGSWQHLVAVLDQPSGRMKLYLNGVERASATPRATLVNTTHEVSIGARKNSGSSSYELNFDGRINEVAIYNRALTPAEILAQFNAAFTNNPATGPDTNDVVFGLTLAAAETLPAIEPLRFAFNELTSATNANFWIEVVNAGRTGADLGGCVLARFGGATNREYVIPSHLLAAGELLQITKAETGFGADSGDRLVLYAPGRTNTLDAVIAKKDARGRSPDGTGAWWFPDHPTPGVSNAFSFHEELVINEIMYHHRELPAEPATFSPTNVLITITNTWRYQAEALDLGTEWRAPGFNDGAWAAGPALFYAPISTITLPAPKNTFIPVTNSAGTRIVTYYFRSQFEFQGETNGLTLALRPLVDDGAVFYLNGVEVFRMNLPGENITYGTLATVNVGLPAFAAPVTVPVGLLVAGINTLAVEVHQVSTSSSDFDFGTELLTWKQLTPARPFQDSPESWVEIFNRSDSPVNLAGWRLDEGIDFRFASNQMITAGGYLVVARDVTHMRTLHPSLQVVGPFTNKLSHRSDLIVLKDPNNNPADEVRYHAGGRWPGFADGGGSSLELRDPRADHSAAEAWSASDESGRSEWQTFSWRGVARAGQAGEPALWHELALGLLDGAGEALIDDVSVIETPATTPRQLLVNRGFDGGSADHWRFLGTHRLSRVESEPGLPSNFVLHLIATGASEYQGNQVEVTLTNNLAIVEGREYEISFRARWLAGKSKLNARLYFNRLARTVELAVPARNGTPGAANSRRVDNLGPTFRGLAHSPVIPNPGESVRVTVAAADPDGLGQVTLRYSVAGGAWQSIPMTEDLVRSPEAGGTVFAASIPPQPPASVVQFHVEAVDTLGALALFPAGGTNSRALYVVQDGQALPGRRHFRLVMTGADAAFLHTATNTLSNELLGGTVISDENEVFYDVGARLKGSFVGRNVARVGFHIAFDPAQPFRGVHDVVSVDRAMHTVIGNVGEIIVKHIASHAGGIPNVYDDVARFIAPLPSYTTMAGLRLSAFDNDWLDAQFKKGSEGGLFEVEVLRWNLNTVNGNPEAPKAVGNESGGTGYANLELQDYGANQENYRWLFLPVNNRTQDDFTAVTNFARTFSLAGTNLEASARQWLDVEEWLRTMAYQQLVGAADAYFTGANIHNFRIYVRPEDQRVLYLPWDWDSSFLASTAAPILGTGNISKLLATPGNRRNYLSHLSELITTTFNTGYMSRWTAHYGAATGQDYSSVLTYIQQRAAFVLGQLPNAVFAVTNNGGNNFATSNALSTLAGTAPIGVRTIEINGVAYPITWTSDTAWRLTVPLFGGTNLLLVQGVDAAGRRPASFLDTITVTNTGPGALQPVVINEWMADNAAPGGYPDPADGLFQDWFELFNPNTTAVNLSGYFLTDTLSAANKWPIPSGTLIGPRDFLLVWADEDGAENLPGLGLHASFKLNAAGEALALYSPAGVLQHAVAFGPQAKGVSQGLFPDGDTNTVYSMSNWTPRAANRLGLPPNPTFNSLVLQPGGVFSLSHSAVPGRAYELQSTESLTAPAWRPLQAVRATGATVTFADTPSASAQRFYRVVLVP